MCSIYKRNNNLTDNIKCIYDEYIYVYMSVPISLTLINFKL